MLLSCVDYHSHYTIILPYLQLKNQMFQGKEKAQRKPDYFGYGGSQPSGGRPVSSSRYSMMALTGHRRMRQKVSMVWVLTLSFRLRRVSYPLLLHPDESATVDYAIDMLSRHSWMAASFDRPDHFEIKCDALLFAIFSRLRYGVPAYPLCTGGLYGPFRCL